MDAPLGRIATRGNSFRARAEARQREYRAEVLKAGCSKYGHWLDDEAAKAGMNFVTPECFEAAKERAARGKGVAERTFVNMLSSQAMCFNLFTPMAHDLQLATKVLRPFFPSLKLVREIHFEYTPPNDIFGDQTGLGGVDCDLMIEAEWNDGTRAIITIETKFVETEFSICGFCKPGRKSKGQPVCPGDVRIRDGNEGCLYASKKHYRYWEQSRRLKTLRLDTLPETGCPFAGPEWQLWVNHTLANALAEIRGAKHAVFAVCAPAGNDALLSDGVLDRFRARLLRPDSFTFIPLDGMFETIAAERTHVPEVENWCLALRQRYSVSRTGALQAREHDRWSR